MSVDGERENSDWFLPKSGVSRAKGEYYKLGIGM